MLSLLAGCWTNSRGHINVPATTGIWGGALVVGGAVVGAGSCQPSPEQCEHIERGDPIVAGTLVVAGVSLLALAYLFDRADAGTP